MRGNAALTGLLGAAIISSLWNAAHAEGGWSILQRSSTGSPMSGATLFITPTGMKAVEPRSGLNFFTKGPQWGVVMYNTQTKNIYQTNLNTWLQSLQNRKASNKFEGATWKRGGSTVVSGIRAYEFIIDRPPTSRGMYRGPDGKMKSGGPAITGGKLYVAEDISTPPQVSNLISKIYGVPDCQRIPLKLIITEAGRPPMVAMETVKVQKVDVPAAAFAAPTGYRPVKSDMDVFIDKESMKAIDDMLKDL